MADTPAVGDAIAEEAAPSPSVVARRRIDAAIHQLEFASLDRPNVDFLRRLGTLFEQADMLVDHAAPKQVDGKAKIKNPFLFKEAVKLQNDLLETALHALREVWDLQRMQDFYDIVVAEVAVESPECARRIMDRLSNLNKERGFGEAARKAAGA